MLDFLYILAVIYAISVLPVTAIMYHGIMNGGFTVENMPAFEWLLEYAPAALAFFFGLTWPYWLWFGRVSFGDEDES